MGLPSSPGPGPYPLSLDTPAFGLLVGLLLVFAFMFWVLWHRYPRRKRGVEGYLDAAGIDLVFLLVAVLVVVAVAWHDPHGNRTSLALYRVVLTGYWLTFSIPVVTVGSSVHSHTRGGIPWLLPSIIAAVGLFGILFAYFFATA